MIRVLGMLGLAALLAAVAAFAWFSLLAPEDEPVLVFSAGSPGGEYHGFATAVAELARMRAPGFTVTVRESAGASENVRAVAAGEAQLALVQSDIEAPPSVLAIASVFPETLHVVVRDAAGIETVGDLAGRRIALMPEGSGTNAVFARVAAHYDLAPGDIDVVHLSPADAAQAIRRGEVDAMVRMIALGNAGMRELLADESLRLLAVRQSEAVQMFAPGLRRIVIPEGALAGNPPDPPEDIEAIGVSALLVAGEDVPDAVVRDLTAMLFEARNQLVRLDEQAALMEPPPSFDALGLALHPGAAAFYDADKPGFLERNVDQIGLALSVGALLASLAWQARRWMTDRRKNRSDAHNTDLADAIEALRTAQTPAEIDAIEARMFAIFRTVLADIDADRVEPSSIPTFDFVWRSAIDMLGQRRAELRARSDAGRPAGRGA